MFGKNVFWNFQKLVGLWIFVEVVVFAMLKNYNLDADEISTRKLNRKTYNF